MNNVKEPKEEKIKKEQVLCETCNGTGFNKETERSCPECDGAGVK